MTSTAPSEPSRGSAVAGTAVASAVIMGCGLVTGVIAARVLGPSGRGELTALIVWASTLLYAGTLGIPEAVAYHAADRAQRARVWATGQAMALVFGVFVSFAGWWIVPIFFGAGAELPVSIRWYLAWFAIPALGSLCATAWLQGAGYLGRFNISRATVHVVQALGAVLLLVSGGHSVRQFAIVMLVGVAICWFVAGTLGPVRAVLAASPSPTLARRMLHYGSRVQFGSWASAANVRLDQLLLSVFAIPHSLGVYVVAVSYANLLLTVPSAASFVMLSDVLRQHREGTARKCIEEWYRRLLWITVLATTVVSVPAAFIVPRVFGADFEAAVPLLILLVPATAVLGMNEILMTAFRGTGRPEVGSVAQVIGLVVTVAALAALMPRYGVYGAATASLLAYGSSHLYMLRQAFVIFGTDVRSLWIPTHEDVAAVRAAWMTARRRIATRSPDTTRGTEGDTE